MTKKLLAELRSIVEDSEHNPFKNKSRLGPGPRGGYNRERRRWQCSGSNYTQTCIGIAENNKGQVIEIVIDPEYKAEYNREYKRFRANKKRRKKRKRTRKK